ncbi:zinc finger BED domain-containing protein 1-like, partial [Nasonia vitripennis]|uniref:HAT C-terminal dimerisation domain-containing protein n=1 Tax=Nasonia vitripennis TaxID=7425 RepID=A0A7M7R0W6_NASVI
LESSIVTTATGIHFQTKLIEQFNKRFENIEKKSIMAMATLLDPRFKKLYFKNKIACADAINKIAKQIHNLRAHLLEDNQNKSIEAPEDKSDNNDFWSYHHQLFKANRKMQKENQNQSEMPEELRFYLNGPLISKDNDPLVFWKMYPNSSDSILADLAIHHLIIIATSVPSERLFSTAGLIMTSNRNRLLPEHFQQLLF